VSTSETISAAINFAALVFLGAQVMLARRALGETAKAQQQEWERQRKKASIEASVSTARYREALKAVLPWNDRDPEEMAAFLKEVNGDHAKLYPVREYLNHLVDIAVGVKQGVFDLDTISMLEGGRIIDVVASYAPYIESVRQEAHRPRIYEDIEDLAELIKAHRQESPGGPGESHPRAPTERSVKVSLHSARLILDLVRIRSSRPSGRTCGAAVRSARATICGLS